MGNFDRFSFSFLEMIILEEECVRLIDSHPQTAQREEIPCARAMPPCCSPP